MPDEPSIPPNASEYATRYPTAPNTSTFVCCKTLLMYTSNTRVPVVAPFHSSANSNLTVYPVAAATVIV